MRVALAAPDSSGGGVPIVLDLNWCVTIGGRIVKNKRI